METRSETSVMRRGRDLCVHQCLMKKCWLILPEVTFEPEEGRLSAGLLKDKEWRSTLDLQMPPLLLEDTSINLQASPEMHWRSLLGRCSR